MGSAYCYGDQDVELADGHPQQILEVVEQVQGFKGQVLTSPLSRCKILADTLAQQLDRNLVSLDGLKEMDFGDWELQKWDALPKEELRQWREDIGHYCPPNGETFNSVKERAVVALTPFLQNKEDIIVVSHGGTIRALLTYFLKLPIERGIQFDIKHGASVLIQAGGRTGKEPDFFQVIFR